ncbi:MAG: hypothetical protein GXX95_05025 [Methanomassiliicoccus sp.]|jgi:hypothetical protein|nr:hypothetical protein [Methanomassiliicoccus sp.]
MPSCHEMKMDQVYVCKDCGLELQVVKECKECGAESCGCVQSCSFECCGSPMALRE